jgi:beta-alanine--pyruvate transaminase
MMSLKGLPNVLDIRCIGLTGAIDLAPIPGSPGERVYRALDYSFFEAGIMIRPAGDTIELMPPLIISEKHIGEIMDKVTATIKAVA